MKEYSFPSIAVKTTLVHTVTYFVIGVLSFFFLDYSVKYADPTVALALRQTDHPMVAAGALFQVLRGFLFGIAFYALRDLVFPKPRGWLTLWLVLLIVGIFSPFSSAPGSIEGIVYSTLPMWFHIMSLPELLVQSFLLAFATHCLVNHPDLSPGTLEEMTVSLSVAYTALFYVAILVFFVGVGLRIVKYAKTPAPLKIPTTPAPITQGGVVLRMFRVVVFFQSLFKSYKWIWIFGWIFHLSLLLAFFRHLRYAMSPDNVLWPLVSLEIVQSFGKYAGFAMVVGLVGLFGRRIFVDRVRYISSPSDYLMLILLFAIAASGLSMSFVAHTDIA